ncbi:zinc finger CCCH domain-containing protein 18 isoform X1 [Lucilia sericata]|uniref:zinc finger CCCH domain-containing protein 18 isoform X1 n=1 Tax=Lucilia sericata TaxID=13632 RepID=UPI0018A82717|nr:zinc finger CCCH domain-containing protein 18 isoform X1 [Lucilia sericata]XP_037821348.1 zinc finger CCCH domain-containing protein 18 isoform X1 [Lucilia sericata]
MDSDDSRPGSSASNSSSHSSQNSNNYNEIKHDTSSHIVETSPTSSSRSRRSRRSGSVYEDSQNSRSKSKSDSDSSSNTSLSDDDDDETKSSNNVNPEKNSILDCAESDKAIENKRNVSTSPSLISRHSSRESSLSSNHSRSNSAELQQENSELNITHEDLSDVSDLESEKRTSVYNTKLSVEDINKTDGNDFGENENNITDLRQKLEKKKYQLNEKCTTPPKEDEKISTKGKAEESFEDLVKAHDEDALDFEAEEGECHEASKNDAKEEPEKGNYKNEEKINISKKDEDELEEGEVSDEDEKRPEETEPKPVCRFYTRGQCTWGMSCRFLHPGVTDKGNYTMFDLVRPVPLPPSGSNAGNRGSTYSLHTSDFHDYRNERPVIHHRSSSLHHNTGVYPPNHETRKVALDGPVVVESAWERGLRTAKEMMRKANKRKEQDMDFEDKKMNLTLSPDELEKDPYYLKERLSPSENARHSLYVESATDVYNGGDRYGRGPPLTHYDEVDPYGRSTRYRELPPHRMPQYEDERRIRPAREVIVQRVEPIGRSDDWNDPWMRSKSPNGRGGSRDHGEKRRRERRSYSSNSSYTSSSSSQSDSSSDSSRSLSPRDRHRRRYNSSSHKTSPSLTRRSGGRNIRSLTPPPRKLRGSPSLRQSPGIKRRSDISSPVYNRNTYSPVHKRKRLSPLTKKIRGEKGKIRRRHSSSSSDSDSTASDSDSDSGSSSSESSSQSREHTPPKRLRISDRLSTNERKGLKKDLPKKRSPISIELKKPTTVGVSALTSPTQGTTSEKDSKKSRREELLKQLRAVEDAIAKKRSKLA